MTHSLQEVAAAQGSFRVAFPHAAEKIQKIILQLKEVQACIPPCGKHIIQSSELRGKGGGRGRNLGQMGEDGWASDPKGANTSHGEK
eukprot:bmy_19232T0